MTVSTLVLRSGVGVGHPDVTGIVLHGLYPQGITPPPTPGGTNPRWFSLNPTPGILSQGAFAGPTLRAHSLDGGKNRRG